MFIGILPEIFAAVENTAEALSDGKGHKSNLSEIVKLKMNKLLFRIRETPLPQLIITK